ncbi:hypothetical protein DO72_5822 [Burkholderia pseudomallei]|nr:hypothetical protein DO72_5822 [Burkholderia pseudomallei]
MTSVMASRIAASSPHRYFLRHFFLKGARDSLHFGQPSRFGRRQAAATSEDRTRDALRMRDALDAARGAVPYAMRMAVERSQSVSQRVTCDV